MARCPLQVDVDLWEANVKSSQGFHDLQDLCALQRYLWLGKHLPLFVMCSASPTCLPPTSDLGAIVFKGLYSPVRNLPTDHALYQNCTVTVPPVFAKGFGQFSVAHFDVIAPAARISILQISRLCWS
ncbi:hypothetical protein B0H10DRAFT_2027657, partial [Mycena sp. CBHHK59/15]